MSRSFSPSPAALLARPFLLVLLLLWPGFSNENDVVPSLLQLVGHVSLLLFAVFGGLPVAELFALAPAGALLAAAVAVAVAVAGFAEFAEIAEIAEM